MADTIGKPHLNPASSHVEHVLETQVSDSPSLHHHNLDVPEYDDINHPKVRNNMKNASVAAFHTDASPPRTGRWRLD
jgi:hypothetical protein